MIQKFSNISKESKIELIRSIVNSDVIGINLTPDTFVAITPKDAFMGMMMQASGKDGEAPNVVYIGEAQKTISEFNNPILNSDL